MEQNSKNKIDFKFSLINFFDRNKIKLLIFFLVIILVFFIIFFIKYKNENKNVNISEKYVQAVIYLSQNDKDEARKIFENIILSKNNFYSLVALNKIIEKELVKDKEKIFSYFEILEKSNSSKEYKDLLILKKALFLIKNLELNNGNDLLKQLIEKDSNLKPIAKELLKQ